MVKVRPSASARADTGVGLTGARNEFVSFQVVVNGNDTGASGVAATLTGLQGPSGSTIGGSDITLYREAYLNITSPSFADSTVGLWPDALIPATDEIAQQQRSAFPFSVSPGQAGAIWVDIHIPQSATPGVYTGSVQVSGANALSQSVSVTLTVAPFALPSTASIATAFLIDGMQVCLAHTGDSSCNGNTTLMNQLLTKYGQMALEHRFTLTNLWSAPGSGGPWTGFDTYATPFMNGTTSARLPGAQATTLQYVGPVDAQSYAYFQAHLQPLGWLARAFDYTGDEPPNGTSVAAIQSRAAIVKQGAPNLSTLVTTSAQNASSEGILSDINNITPVVNFMDGDAAPYLGDQRSAYTSFLASNPLNKVWMYQSCMSQGCGGFMPENTATSGWPTYLVDVPAARNRGMEWVSFREQVQGELYYETALSLPNAWNSIYAFNGNGDGDLFYPGTAATIGGTSDVPVASIRMKMIRMGLQDLEWLKHASDLGDSTFPQTVAAALVPSAWQVPDDGAAFERAKLQLVSRVNQLMKVTPGPAVQGGPPAQPASDLAGAITTGTDPVTTYVPLPANVNQTGGAGGAGGSVGSVSGSSGGSSASGGASAQASKTVIGCQAAPVGAASFPLGLGLTALWLLVRKIASRRACEAPARARSRSRTAR